jgi:hypothetical protein
VLAVAVVVVVLVALLVDQVVVEQGHSLEMVLVVLLILVLVVVRVVQLFQDLAVLEWLLLDTLVDKKEQVVQ